MGLAAPGLDGFEPKAVVPADTWVEEVDVDGFYRQLADREILGKDAPQLTAGELLASRQAGRAAMMRTTSSV